MKIEKKLKYSECSTLNLYVCTFLQVVENAVFPTNPEAPLWRHITVTCTIVGLTAAVSMATDCLGIVLELNVSVTSVLATHVRIFPFAVESYNYYTKARKSSL